MFLCDNCPAFICDMEKEYACNVLPSCRCEVCGERIKPVMVCIEKDKLEVEK